jgi:molybdopterin-binding protein
MRLRRELQRLKAGLAMKISARNQLAGTVASVSTGAINSEVVIDVGGVQVVAVITNDSVKRLGLAAGKKAYAVVKASDVMVAID